MLTVQHSKELLSRAHLQALAAAARLNLEFRSDQTPEFDYGVDGSFRPIEIVDGLRIDSGCPLDFQLKSSGDWQHTDGYIVYDLESKSYNKLVSRESRATPYILILLCLPQNVSDAVVLSTSGLSQSNYYYEKIVSSMCPSLPSQSSCLNDSERI
jgi:Domain of unknown function (DUF4365)